MKTKLAILAVVTVFLASCKTVVNPRQDIIEPNCVQYGIDVAQCIMPDGYTCVFYDSGGYAGGVDCYKPEK